MSFLPTKMNLRLPVMIDADEELFIPKYAHPDDAGTDLVCAEDFVRIRPGEVRLIDCGFSMAIPFGWVGLIHPRSGLAIKHQVTVINAPGTIDAGYRGRIKVALINHNPNKVYTILRGNRIAQLIFQRVEQVNFQAATINADTDRGEGGFGSTGDN